MAALYNCVKKINGKSEEYLVGAYNLSRQVDRFFLVSYARWADLSSKLDITSIAIGVILSFREKKQRLPSKRP